MPTHPDPREVVERLRETGRRYSNAILGANVSAIYDAATLISELQGLVDQAHANAQEHRISKMEAGTTKCECCQLPVLRQTAYFHPTDAIYLCGKCVAAMEEEMRDAPGPHPPELLAVVKASERSVRECEAQLDPFVAEVGAAFTEFIEERFAVALDGGKNGTGREQDALAKLAGVLEGWGASSEEGKS